MPKKLQLAGQDYVLKAAIAAEEAGLPQSSLFRTSVMAAIVGGDIISDGLVGVELASMRPLRDYEETPVRAVSTAATIAAQHRDIESLRDIAVFGSIMLARWPLIMIWKGVHPELQLKKSPPRLPPPAAPPGWYGDPAGEHEQRYFDASGWSSHVSDGGQVSSHPLPA